MKPRSLVKSALLPLYAPVRRMRMAAYAGNDVYLGGDFALTHAPLADSHRYIVRMW